MRIPGQIQIFHSPEGQSGGDSGAASVGGGAASSAGSTDGGPPGPASSAPSAPSASPSSTSSEPLVTTSPDAGVDDSTPSDAFDFSSLLNGQFENGEVTTPVAPVVAQPVPATPATPVPAPVATPAAPAVAPVAPPAAAVAPGQQAPLSLAEPGRLAEAMASQEAAIVEEAARTMFALSPEEITGLEENAVAVIPKLLARTYVQAQRSMLMTLQRALPAMLGTHLTQKQTHETNENKFYERWKDAGINRSHSALVTRLATMYRRMNPQATYDQMVEELGPAVVMAAKITPPAPGAPARPGNGFARPQAQPFVPAGGGPGVISSQPQGESWDILDPSRIE